MDITYKPEKLCTSKTHKAKSCISLMPNGFNFQFKTTQPQNPLMCHQDCNEYKTVFKAKEFVKRTTALCYNSPHNKQTFSLP